jgi:NADH-quinone oxidoreductase subunit D
MGELMETYSMIRQLISKLPAGPIVAKMPRKIPAGEAIARYEAPRGEDVHYVKANGTEKPERVKVRAPTLANIQTVAKMLEDRYLADMPIVVAAIDPCFSCTDRMIETRAVGSDNASTFSWGELRKYSIEWYKNKGIDFEVLNAKRGKR